MKIELAPEHRERYLEYLEEKKRSGIPQRERPEPRIRICHLTPRQRKKKIEMNQEDLP